MKSKISRKMQIAAGIDALSPNRIKETPAVNPRFLYEEKSDGEPVALVPESEER